MDATSDTKQKFLKQAQSGDFRALDVVLNAAEQTFLEYTDFFEDDETHEIVPVPRKEMIERKRIFTDAEIGDVDAILLNIADHCETMSTDDLLFIAQKFFLYDTIPFLDELHKRGDRWATIELARKNLWGDEEHGIFANFSKAKVLYDEVNEAYEIDGYDNSRPDEPSFYEYTLRGRPEDLNLVKQAIDQLIERYADEMVIGFCLPQQFVMQLLVGTGDTSWRYRGEINSINASDSTCLVIKTIANDGEPLFYALRVCFRDIQVEMKELDLW